MSRPRRKVIECVDCRRPAPAAKSAAECQARMKDAGWSRFYRGAGALFRCPSCRSGPAEVTLVEVDCALCRDDVFVVLGPHGQPPDDLRNEIATVAEAWHLAVAHTNAPARRSDGEAAR